MARILIKRGTETQWTNSTTALLSGELGLDTTNNILKAGNGTALWNALPGITLTSTQVSELAQDAVSTAFSNGTHTNIIVTYNDNGNSISLSTGPDVVTTTSLSNTLTNPSSGYVAIADVGNVDGVAPLDENSLIPDAYIPSTITRDSEVEELAQDAVGNAVGNGLDYNDTTGAISVDPSEFALSAVGAPTSDVSMASYKITNLGTPTSSGDAVNKSYVDGLTSGFDWKAAVNLLANTNVALSGSTGTLIIDGHAALTSVDTPYRILLKGQSTSSENGIYSYTDDGSTYTLVRPTDADAFGKLIGAAVFVMEGSSYGTTSWVQSNHYLTNFSNQSWTQFSGAGTYSAGTGLTLTGTSFSINTATTVDLNTAQTLTNKTITGTFTGNVTGNVTGNAGTVTNGVYTSGSYSDPSWLTISKSKVGLSNVDNTSDQDKYKNDYSSSAATTVNLSSSTHKFTVLEVSSGSPISVVIPSDAQDSGWQVGSFVEVRQVGDGQVTVNKDAAVTYNAPDNQFKTRTKWSSLFIEKRAANTWLVTGDATA